MTTKSVDYITHGNQPTSIFRIPDANVLFPKGSMLLLLLIFTFFTD